jgi:hypothetical protein
LGETQPVLGARDYDSAIRAVVSRFSKWNSIRSIFLFHSTSTEEFIEGVSDIDVGFIFRDLPSQTEREKLLGDFLSSYNSLRSRHRFLGEAQHRFPQELTHCLGERNIGEGRYVCVEYADQARTVWGESASRLFPRPSLDKLRTSAYFAFVNIFTELNERFLRSSISPELIPELAYFYWKRLADVFRVSLFLNGRVQWPISSRLRALLLVDALDLPESVKATAGESWHLFRQGFHFADSSESDRWLQSSFATALWLGRLNMQSKKPLPEHRFPTPRRVLPTRWNLRDGMISDLNLQWMRSWLKMLHKTGSCEGALLLKDPFVDHEFTACLFPHFGNGRNAASDVRAIQSCLRALHPEGFPPIQSVYHLQTLPSWAAEMLYEKMPGLMYCAHRRKPLGWGSISLPGPPDWLCSSVVRRSFIFPCHASKIRYFDEIQKSPPRMLLSRLWSIVGNMATLIVYLQGTSDIPVSTRESLERMEGNLDQTTLKWLYRFYERYAEALDYHIPQFFHFPTPPDRKRIIKIVRGLFAQYRTLDPEWEDYWLRERPLPPLGRA